MVIGCVMEAFGLPFAITGIQGFRPGYDSVIKPRPHPGGFRFLPKYSPLPYASLNHK
jgi:hypothetical protein